MIHLVRSFVWPILLPVALSMGWQNSVFLLLIISLYANWATDIGAYQAWKARREVANSEGFS